jgi:hypothetical protein
MSWLIAESLVKISLKDLYIEYLGYAIKKFLMI